MGSARPFGANATKCELCGAGTYGNRAGLAKCITCPAGSGSKAGSASDSDCAVCGKGKYRAKEMTDCTVCCAGTYAPAAGLGACC